MREAQPAKNIPSAGWGGKIELNCQRLTARLFVLGGAYSLLCFASGKTDIPSEVSSFSCRFSSCARYKACHKEHNYVCQEAQIMEGITTPSEVPSIPVIPYKVEHKMESVNLLLPARFAIEKHTYGEWDSGISSEDREDGIKIKYVDPDLFYARLGIRDDDIIRAVDGKVAFDTYLLYKYLVKSLRDTDQVSLIIERANRVFQQRVVLSYTGGPQNVELPESEKSAIAEAVINLKAGEFIKQRQAIERLGEIGEDAAGTSALLIPFLEITHFKWNAEMSLWQIGSGALFALRDALKMPSKDILRSSLLLLGKLNLQARPAMKNIIELLSSSDNEVREAAAKAIAEIGGSESHSAVPVLIHMLKSDSAIPIQIAAASALGTAGVGSSDARRALSEALANEKVHSSVKSEARLALTSLDSPF